MPWLGNYSWSRAFRPMSEVGGIALQAASWTRGNVTIVLEIARRKNRWDPAIPAKKTRDDGEMLSGICMRIGEWRAKVGGSELKYKALSDGGRQSGDRNSHSQPTTRSTATVGQSHS